MKVSISAASLAVTKIQSALRRGGCVYTDSTHAARSAKDRGLMLAEECVAEELQITAETVRTLLRSRGFTPLVAAKWWAQMYPKERSPVISYKDPNGHSRRERAAMRRIYKSVVNEAFGRHQAFCQGGRRS